MRFRKKDKTELKRTLLVVLGCLSASMVFGRCSPVAPNLDKSQIRGPGTPFVLPENPTIYVFPTHGVDGDAYSNALSGSASKSRAIFINEHELADQLEEFRRSATAIIPFEGAPPQTAAAVFELDLDPAAIEKYELNKFKTVFTPVDAHHWKLSVSSNVPAVLIEVVQKKLLGIVITMNGDDQALIVTPSPRPKPSPSPTPSPSPSVSESPSASPSPSLSPSGSPSPGVSASASPSPSISPSVSPSPSPSSAEDEESKGKPGKGPKPDKNKGKGKN